MRKSGIKRISSVVEDAYTNFYETNKKCLFFNRNAIFRKSVKNACFSPGMFLSRDIRAPTIERRAIEREH
uniref:Uncharacterized protein n=1 Tax=Romanomermis culicivorax TaxID=13658 RepID=A0A915KI88_ROMCU